ncbi:Haloacid dehalogenase domain protein hydrolase [Rhodopirellula baltica SH28]|uniref:Haloacid dehalogenase domain protein hydrolase n=1 Tax=Rhodopirellula baltica SH28 TaxID=993517 RepID=K5D7N4_RHOBT|nr:HAD family hydrolase [Rhodopirellula baltica]EKJ98803.1 Haloacid dehalogenase domain protein hydrolase [Rhodopirellula baltica SH28]
MRVLLFDIDGTLLTTAGGGNRAIRQAIEEEFAVENPDTQISFSGRTDRSLMVELLQRNRVSPTKINCGRLRRRYGALFGAELRRSGGTLLPGIVPLFQALNALPNLDIAVMTGNFPETATQKLEHFEIRRWVRWIIGGDLDVHRDDMARRAAMMVARRHGDAHQETIVIGDTPADVLCGRAIGAKTLAVTTGEFSREQLATAEPTLLLDDLSDTERVMRFLVDDEVLAD